MKAIIEVDIPDYQIGQEVSIYFKDTMMIKGIVQEPKTGHWRANRRCSICGVRYGGIYNNYCPNCGARMVEPQEREE